jgi:hypothetical protein
MILVYKLFLYICELRSFFWDKWDLWDKCDSYDNPIHPIYPIYPIHPTKIKTLNYRR